MPLTGPQKVGVLLCKFSDTAITEPHPRSYYEDLFVHRGTGGLNDYFHDASLGHITLDGSEVFGWATLATTKADFLAAHPGRSDKIWGAVAALPEVDASQFRIIVALFNVEVGDSGFHNGVLGGPGDGNATFLGHELGHGLGLGHSFDTSARKNAPWSGPGEYFDWYDLMSAMACANDGGHRFSPRGPLLNVAHLARMGWLPPERVWEYPAGMGSYHETIDIVALEHPRRRGYLAAKAGEVYVEFRLPDGWDTGIGHPCVLLHTIHGLSTMILPSSAAHFNNEFHPGQGWGTTPQEMLFTGGTRIEVLSWNLRAGTARIRVQHTVGRLFVDGPGQILGGVASDGGGLLILPSGKIIRIPPRSPLLAFAEAATEGAEEVADYRALAEAMQREARRGRTEG